MGTRIITEEEILQLGEPCNFKNTTKHSVFYKDNIYYKIWGFGPIGPFVTFDGLDAIWHGNHTLASLKVGLLTGETCHAFKDTLHDTDGNCIGYSMHAGKIIDKFDPRYKTFINKLVEVSIETGYLYKDIAPYNIIDFNNKLSIIDVGFTPMKIHHNKKLSPNEWKVWIYMINYERDSDYVMELKKAISKYNI